MTVITGDGVLHVLDLECPCQTTIHCAMCGFHHERSLFPALRRKA